MRKFISLTAAILSLSMVTPAFAATYRGNVITPDGFCSVHTDGTKGIRFDGKSYTAWLAIYAMTQERLSEAVSTSQGTELEIAQLKAKLLKAAAELQRLRIDQG